MFYNVTCHLSNQKTSLTNISSGIYQTPIFNTESVIIYVGTASLALNYDI